MSDLKLSNKFVLKNIESYIKTALVFLIIYLCFLIFKPFMIPVVWGIIIAIAIYPLHQKLTKLVRKSSLSSAIITIVFLAILIIPSISFSTALIDSIQELTTGIKEGTLAVAPPSDKVAEWPIIGKKVHAAWLAFSDSMTAGIQKYSEELKGVAGTFVSFLSSFAGSILAFIVSIIIAGIFLNNAEGANKFSNTFFSALIGKKGPEIAENSRKTISSVVTGVLGTAVIQTLIIAIALFVFKIPAAPIFSLIILFFAIAQIPVIIVVLPLIIYMFSAVGGASAIIFAIWALLGALSDNILKPMLLGRGLNIPMVIILIGAIGGMVLMGIIGLFIGAVVLALGYQLFQLWIEDTEEQLEKEETETE